MDTAERLVFSDECGSLAFNDPSTLEQRLRDVQSEAVPPAAYKNFGSVTNAEFVSGIFLAEHQKVLERPIFWTVQGDPEGTGILYGEPRHSADSCYGQSNNYVNCATFQPSWGGNLSPSNKAFAAVVFLLLDDVGTKVNRKRLRGFVPTWEIETSPGNSQMGFVFDMPLADREYAKALQEAAVTEGLCDPQISNIEFPFARLPIGINGKRAAKNPQTAKVHSCQLVQWNPALRYSPQRLLSELIGSSTSQTALASSPIAVDGVQAINLPERGASQQVLVDQVASDIDTSTQVDKALLDAGVLAQIKSLSRTSNTTVAPGGSRTPLDKYSLAVNLQELEKNLVDQHAVLGNVVLSGQATVVYAKPNAGKTLISLHMVIEGIRKKLFDPSKLFYLNMDDNLSGLETKAQIASQYGFHMASAGYLGFDVHKYMTAMNEMTVLNQAAGVIVVLDTLTKFVDSMNKSQSRAFAGVVRDFVLKGGTVLALAHVNKKLGVNGQVEYAGTADIVNEFDCAYTLAEFPESVNKGEKVVVFERFKNRGASVSRAAYSYSTEDGISYEELLTSVTVLDPEQLKLIPTPVELLADSEVIAAIEACIRSGITQKMRLRDAVAQVTNSSGRQAIRVIDSYDGRNPTTQRWKFRRGAKGVQNFELTNSPSIKH